MYVIDCINSWFEQLDVDKLTFSLSRIIDNFTNFRWKWQIHHFDYNNYINRIEFERKFDVCFSIFIIVMFWYMFESQNKDLCIIFKKLSRFISKFRIMRSDVLSHAR